MKATYQPEDLVAQLALGLGKAHFARGEWFEAEERFVARQLGTRIWRLSPKPCTGLECPAAKRLETRLHYRKLRKLFSRSTAIPVGLRKRQFGRVDCPLYVRGPRLRAICLVSCKCEIEVTPALAILRRISLHRPRFGKIRTTSVDPRAIQFGAKIVF